MTTRTANRLNPILDAYLSTARQAGCPPDQLLNFRRGGYVAQPKQLLFSAAARECDAPGGPTQVGFGGARGPGKSHGAFAQVALDDCQRVPGLKFLYLRKVGKQAREQFEDLRRAVLFNTPHKYNRTEGVIYFQNGSRILIGHFQNEADVDNYLGIQYDGVLTEEATTLSSTKRQSIRDSLRTSIPGWRPRNYDTTNPGGVGHAWFKATYIIPARDGRETDTRFIFATVDDNRFIDPDYKTKLEQNTGWRLRAYRYGDWDIAAGQFFTPFRSDIHVIKPRFDKVPADWPVWGSLDYGYVHPTVYYLHTMNDGIVYTIAEHWRQRQKVSQHATAIKELWARWGVTPGQNVAGHDVFHADETGPMIADKYKAEGVPLEPAIIDRVNGWAEMLDRLGDPDQGIEPRWYIFNTCPKLAECLPALEHNPHKPEDVLKWNIDENGRGGDDCFVGGTPILTNKGLKAIERLQPGDMVLTRIGYQPVASGWLNRRNSPTVKVKLSNGVTLNCTPNHPFWIDGKSFCYADDLRYGDMMLQYLNNKYLGDSLWQNQKLLSLMVLNSDDTPNLNTLVTEAITLLAAITPSEALGLYTSKYGSRFTAMFRQAIMSIIETEIPSITTLAICNLLITANTASFIPSTTSLSASILSGLDPWRQYGITRPMAGNGIANTPKKLCLRGNQLNAFVNNAERNTLQKELIRAQDFARTSARRNGDALPVLTILKNLVRGVAMSLLPTKTKEPYFAPVRVLEVTEGEAADTFAIHVHNCHEYYAGGVLVKNSGDAARYGLMLGRSSGWLSFAKSELKVAKDGKH